MDSFEESIEKLGPDLANGDRAALGKLFELSHQRLRNLIQFRLHPRLQGRLDVDDVLQEIFLDAEKRMKHFPQNNEMAPYLWLRTIAGQTLADLHRRHLSTQMRDAGREISLHRGGAAHATSQSLASLLVGSYSTPSRIAARAELVDQLEQALATMSEVDQEILALRHFEELNNKEVAEVLGISQKNASIRYIRALTRLKRVAEKVLDMSSGSPPE